MSPVTLVCDALDYYEARYTGVPERIWVSVSNYVELMDEGLFLALITGRDTKRYEIRGLPVSSRLSLNKWSVGIQIKGQDDLFFYTTPEPDRG